MKKAKPKAKKKSGKPIDPELIAEMSEKGIDTTHFFSKGRMVEGYDVVERRQTNIQRVNVDLTNEMLTELDEQVRRMNISRQALMKLLIRIGLNDLQKADEIRQTKANAG